MNQLAHVDETVYRPYVVSWNLTYRCNLACEHCYLDAGGKPSGLPIVTDAAFADKSELDTEGCLRVVDQIAALAPEALTILTGGEPLLRPDILEIVEYASSRDLWVVVGTNGVLVSENLAMTLHQAGVRGMALSLDSLDPTTHDRFRRVEGAFDNTVSGAKVLAARQMSFIIQTTVGAHNHDELEAIAEFAHRELAAKVWNLYFLVPSGRGAFVSDMTDEQYDGVLNTVLRLQKKYRDRMMVNAKCAPHFLRTVLADDPASPFIKSFSGGAAGCPAGTQYLGIRPNGDVTPCPYVPLFGGNLKTDSLTDVWNGAEVFRAIRLRDQLDGRCGDCELSSHCGGCRARAYGMVGDLMAEDPLCSHQTGSLVEQARTAFSDGSTLQYGQPVVQEISWEPNAQERIKNVPAFVRGMVVKSVEKWCRERGIETVTVEQLEEIRSRMPTPKVFGRGKGS